MSNKDKFGQNTSGYNNIPGHWWRYEDSKGLKYYNNNLSIGSSIDFISLLNWLKLYYPDVISEITFYSDDYSYTIYTFDPTIKYSLFQTIIDEFISSYLSCRNNCLNNYRKYAMRHIV